MKIQKNEGITLIALVITIIVLLILAGVSISMLTGDNGILNQATNAKEKTTLAEEEEQRKLKEQEAYMEEYNPDVELTEEEATAAGWVWKTDGTITKYNGTESTVYVPTKIGNVIIKKIDRSNGPTAFVDNKNMTKIVIPGNVELDTQLFEGCSNLETIILKEGFTTIPKEAFYSCNKLEYIALPSTLTTIENGAFSYTNIRNIVIPKNVTSVGESIFSFTNDVNRVITVHCEAELPEGETAPEGWDTRWTETFEPGTSKAGATVKVDWGYTR